MLINYDSRVVHDWKIPHITNLEFVRLATGFKRPEKGKSKSAKIGRYENDAKQQPDPTIMISNKFLIDSAVAMI